MRPSLETTESAASCDATCRLHHVGFVVPSIHDVVGSFGQLIGACWNGEIIHDPLHVVRVTFLCSNSTNSTSVELVEPAGPGSPVVNFLKGGGGLHHLCYEVLDLEAQLELSRRSGALIVKFPLPAVAFGGRHIAWVYTSEKLLLEYLQA